MATYPSMINFFPYCIIRIQIKNRSKIHEHETLQIQSTRRMKRVKSNNRLAEERIFFFLKGCIQNSKISTYKKCSSEIGEALKKEILTIVVLAYYKCYEY